MGSYGGKAEFRTLHSFTPDYCPNKITHYESERTGMQVVVVDQEGPKVNGFFVLATEIHDDSGAPHTLEHLCFMGSKTYQYKGFLDKLATRAYSGTNAWTATDHTAYTLDTAGWAGFRQILPVYLEHVLLPTLTDAGCLTEVHHIDGNGLDAGVVYSEMQGVQNTAQELVDLRIKRLLYPEQVGFRYETGGMMEQLRVLTADRIRQFHKDMYQPKNLCVVLFGEINHDELLQTLDEFESSIVDSMPRLTDPFKRPWTESKQTPPLAKTYVETIDFPEEDEEYGQIDIRFLGPECTDFVEMAALTVALLYLAGSPAALLDNTLVEKEQIASGIYFNTDSRPRTEIGFSLSGVETGKLEEVEKRVFEVLKEAMSKDLDMSFMRDCLDRAVRSVKSECESNATALADGIIIDFLFGRRDDSMLKNLASLDRYTKVLSGWEEPQWKGFIQKYISDANHVSILGRPSAKLSKKLEEDESARIEEQRKKLGPEGLEKCAKKLEEAKAENDKEIPAPLLSKFKVPATSSIHFVSTPTARVGPALGIGKPSNKYQKIVDKDDHQIPLFIDFEHIPSNFARVTVMLSTETLPVELRPLLSLYLEAFFALPIEREGKVVDFESVVMELDRDTVGYDIEPASSLGNAECLRVTLHVEIEKYDVAIRWIKELFWSSVFDCERLQAINARLVADIAEAKRSGDSMLAAVHFMLNLAPKSISRARCTLVKALYLKGVKKLLQSDPEQVIDKLQQLRTELCQFPNLRILVITDLDKLQNPVSSWEPFLKSLDVDPRHPPPLTPLGRRLERLSAIGEHPGKSSHVIPMPTIDSSYAQALARGPTEFTDPQLPAIMVAMAYMNAVEGPLWVAVRGTGLAYGTTMSYDLEGGFIYLDVYRSPDAYKAFTAAKDIIRDHMDGTIQFDPLMLEGAISSIVVSFANEQATLAHAAVATFVREIVRELPQDFMQQTLEKVRNVSVEDLKNCLKNVIFDIFRPGKADVLVTCAVGLKEQIKAGLDEAGFAPDVHDLAWFQDDYGLKVEGGGEEDDDDESEADEEENEDDDDDENE